MVRQPANDQIDGTTRLTRVAAALFVLAAVILIGFAAILTPSPADAETDLSGLWKFEFVFSSDSTWVCPDMEIVQIAPNNVTLSSVQCFAGSVISGALNKATGEFLLADCPTDEQGILFCMVLIGTVSPDGNTISGSLDLAGSGESFIATRLPSLATRTRIPPGVGGIGVDPDLRALRLDAPQHSGVGVRLLGVIAFAGATVMGAASWYVWRRSTN